MADFVESYALVTGGGRRLGREFCLALARRGFSILLHYNASSTEAESTAAELRERGVRVLLAGADLSTPAGVAQLAERAAGLGQAWQVLVNSAAVMPAGSLGQPDLEQWQRVLALNLTAPLVLGSQAYRSMRPGGLIVNVTDAGARRAWTGHPEYVISKSALESLTRLQARSFAPQLRVNALAPGLVLRPDDLPEETWQTLVDRLPQKRATPPGDVVAALEYLLDNPSVTGQILTVDGGHSLL